jgi:hypothetical protein
MIGSLAAGPARFISPTEKTLVGITIDRQTGPTSNLDSSITSDASKVEWRSAALQNSVERGEKTETS